MQNVTIKTIVRQTLTHTHTQPHNTWLTFAIYSNTRFFLAYLPVLVSLFIWQLIKQIQKSRKDNGGLVYIVGISLVLNTKFVRNIL